MKRKKKKAITAAELMTRLEADPLFVAKRAQQEEERAKCVSEWQRSEQPLVEELQRAGVEVESVWDLVNTSAPYLKALPILLDHLQRSYPGAVREGIARALAVPDAKFGWDVLLRMYRDEHETRAKDGLAVALAGVTDKELLEDLIAVARDKRHGASRVLLLSALERSSEPRARTALMELGTDAELHEETQVILRRLKRRKR